MGLGPLLHCACVKKLGLTRFAQGLASAVTWSGALAWLTLSTPRARRGQTLGTAFGFAVLGFIVGPAIGAVAELTSVEVVFGGIAVLLGLVALAAASSSPEPLL